MTTDRWAACCPSSSLHGGRSERRTSNRRTHHQRHKALRRDKRRKRLGQPLLPVRRLVLITRRTDISLSFPLPTTCADHGSIPIEMTESIQYATCTRSAATSRRPIARQHLGARCEASPWRLGPRLVLGTSVSMLLEHYILWGAGREFVPWDPLAGLPARPG